MEYVENLFEQKDKYQSPSPNEILTNLNDYNITTIELKKDTIEKSSKEVYPTKESPFLIESKFSNDKNTSTLYINPDYYLENQIRTENLLLEIIKQTKAKSFDIVSKTLITKNIINTLSQNEYLEEVTLARDGKNAYVLSEEDYDIFEESNIKTLHVSSFSEELKFILDPSNYKKHSSKPSNLFFESKITKEDLENLKYLQNKNTKIFIEEENMDDAILISERLHELGKENHVIITIKNKELVTSKILSNHNLLKENIDISLNFSTVPIKEYLRFEKMLYQMIEGSKNLSPFERYIYAYNVVKQYKEYRENGHYPRAARNLYDILENEFMVCIGYNHLLEDLLTKSEIKSLPRLLEVDISYDKEDENEVISSKKAEHSRSYVYINDPKYGIDGFYITDPTWDNNLEKDLYNHLLLTGEEENDTRRYNFIPTSIPNFSIELMNIQSLEEFYQKINFYLDRNGNSKITLKDILTRLMENLEKLSPEFIETLKKQYPELEEINKKWDNEEEILCEIGEFLLTKVNKPISGENIMLAISEVYQKSYHLEGAALQNKLQETREVNKQEQYIQFPKRYKIDEYGNKIELPGISDKFDIDTNGYHK